MILLMFGASLWSGHAWSGDSFRLSEWPASMPAPDIHLMDTEGRQRHMADYRGKVVIIYFGFARCPEVCPTTLATLARVMRTLGGVAGQVQVLFVTLDPEHDTPAVLRSYLSVFGSGFIGLTGSHADINAAAESFSIHYAKVGRGRDYSIDHSTGIYACDKTGRLRLVGDPDTRAEDWTHDLRLLAER